jgi:deltex-like protein
MFFDNRNPNNNNNDNNTFFNYFDANNNNNNFNINNNANVFDIDPTIEILQTIYFNICDKNFTTEPEYAKIKHSKVPISEANKKILSNLQKITNYYFLHPIEIIYKNEYEKSHNLTKEEDKCSICQFNFYSEIIEEEQNKIKSDPSLSYDFNKLDSIPLDSIYFSQCQNHFFHIECIEYLIKNKSSFQCPNCLKIYGILTGNMPKGTMKAFIQNFHCSGYEKTETIEINYNFPNGFNYTGTFRRCFLPNTKEGREILALLKVAFERKLTFTIGTSVTTGVKNTTVWNGIHHKTNISGGSTKFGYPDKTYFNRVKEELAAKGVCKENINENIEDIAFNMLYNKMIIYS